MTPPRPIDKFRRKTAQRLRNNTTLAERKLWRHLRQVPMSGSHFRRQVPIGPYVADFACMASKLLIEVDGGQHAEDARLVYDQNRTRWLEAEGYRVIRFGITRSTTILMALWKRSTPPSMALRTLIPAN